jgi:RND family efflux transporter MFP subunit
MKKPIKYAVLIFIVLVCVAGGIYYALLPTPMRMTEMRLQTAELSFTEQGVVVAEHTMLVFPATQGELLNLYVREGQWVNAGDALLSVDTTALELQLTQIENGILGLEAQHAITRSTLETTRTSLQGELLAINSQAAQAERGFVNHQESVNELLRVQQILIEQHELELEQANEHLARMNTLFVAGVIPSVEYEAAKTTVTLAEAILEAAHGQLAVIAAGSPQNSTEQFEGMRASIVAQINGITQQLSNDASFEAMLAVEQANLARVQHELQNAVVAAPIDGIITTLHALNTNLISAASPVAEITSAGNKHIEVYVSTQDTNSIAKGDTVGITLRRRAGDVNFYGTIEEIGTTAVVRFTALGVEERKVSVRVSPQIPEGVSFGIGYATDVTFYVYREENKFTVPRTALFREDGLDKVWVAVGGSGTAEVRVVETGMELRTETVILNGLNEGDFVINDANNNDLSVGARVIAE